MADITNAINDFKTAVNGEAVRDSFVATINLVNDDNVRILNVIGNVDLPAVASAAEVATTKAAQAAISATQAATSASSVDSKVTTAQTAATQASTSAQTATNAANTAITKAQEATDAKTLILGKVTDAETAAITATNAASTATTKAGEASTSASTASTKAQEATDAATIATTKAAEASDSATTAALNAHTHSNKSILDKITTGTESSYNLDDFVTEDELSELGAGDMTKIVYDTNQNGIVDNAEKVNGLTVEKAVPSDAKFTDTVYTHPEFTASPNGLYKVTINSQGHITAVTAVTSDDIVALGIPSEDLTAEEILTALKTVDGTGSGLDADKLDGKDSTEFAPTSHGTHVTYGDTTTALTSGETGVVGSSGNLARSDHTHTLPAYPDLVTHANAAGLHTTTEKQTEWNKNTTDIVLLQQQSGSLSANDTNVRREVLDIKLKLDEMNVVEYLNKTGIGFFDLFEDTSNVDTGSTTAVISNTDVVFTGTQLLQMLSQNFDNFTTLELAIYDLLRETFTVTPAITNSATISMNITPGSRTIGEKFYYGGEVYTITNVVAS